MPLPCGGLLREAALRQINHRRLVITTSGRVGRNREALRRMGADGAASYRCPAAACFAKPPYGYALRGLARRLDVPIEGPQEEERFWIDALAQQSQRFGFPEVETFEPDRWLEDGDTVQVGNETLEVYHTPGHTPGHVIFFHRGAKLAIGGDVLFAGSIGRTDFSPRRLPDAHSLHPRQAGGPWART